MSPAVAKVLAPVRPVWESAFRDPVTSGHVRLHGLSWTERQAARLGLVALGLLLVSVLMVGEWRRHTLLPLGDGAGLVFLPQGLLGVTLVCLLLAWVMLTWGGLTSAWPVRLLVAALFVLTNPSLSIAASLDLGDHRALRWGGDLILWAYVAVPSILVVSIGLRWLPVRWAQRIVPVLRLLLAAALAVFFLTHLWVHQALAGEGFPAVVQEQVSGAITEISGLLLPMVYVAAVLVIDFSLNASLGVARSVRTTSLTIAQWALVALLAVKLWFILFDELGDWATYAADRPAAVARTVISIGLLAVLVRFVARMPVSEAVGDAKERLLYGGGMVLGLTTIVALLVVGTGIIAITHLGEKTVPGFVTDYPTQPVAVWGILGLAVLALATGIWLLRRRRTDMDRELGSGLVVMSCWALPTLLLNLTDLEIGFSDDLVDLLVTLGVVTVLAMAWRRLTMRLVVVLIAVTVFTWLAMTKGDWIGLVGSLFGLPAVIVVVVGVVFSVAGDAGFTRKSGRAVPQGARVMMFVGYLVLSVTILNWVEATHASDAGDAAASAFFFLGIPWAAWTIGRTLLHAADDVPAS